MKELKLTTIAPKYNLDIKPACSYSPKDLFVQHEGSKYKNIIDYDVKLSNGKNLQRDFVWNIDQKRSLIISILKELQIPNFAVVIYRDDNNNYESTYKIIDGKQRLKTIEEFFNEGFGIIYEGIEYFLSDLDEWGRYRFKCCSLSFNIIYEYPDAMLTDEQLISWFELVNFAGTPQDLNHLEKLKQK